MPEDSKEDLGEGESWLTLPKPGDAMRIGLSTIAYNQPKILVDLIDSAHMTSHEVLPFIFIHSKSQDVWSVCDSIKSKYPNTKLFPYGKNRGVATSWNDAIIEMRDAGCDVWILSNDDVWFTEGDTDKLAAAAVEHRDAYAIFCAGYHVGFDTPINCHGMSCFVMQPIAIETIGFYDENFFPAYNEDVDYSRRIGMAGLKPFIVPDTNIHHVGSAAIKTNPNLANQNHSTHHYNNLYWQNKWGCNVSEDPSIGYGHPFNNRHFHPYFISEKDRHTPYSPYNRGDRDIVVI